MKVYIKQHDSNAGQWIYRGYAEAWKANGYEVSLYKSLNEVNGTDYYLMAIDADVSLDNIKALVGSTRTFLFVQPNSFPKHWGTHPNFISLCSVDAIPIINQMDNVFKWTWMTPDSTHFNVWTNVCKVPLAFDSLSYTYRYNKSYQFDVCYIGGRADNGFNEKHKIMMEHLGAFKDSGLKCGFFINRNISHEIENWILYGSKVSLNIHDAYQQQLGLDTNERTFKALGLTGCLVSDSVEDIKSLNLPAKLAKDPDDMLDLVYEMMDEPDLENIRSANRQYILDNHTYLKRVEEFLQ